MMRKSILFLFVLVSILNIPFNVDATPEIRGDYVILWEGDLPIDGLYAEDVEQIELEGEKEVIIEFVVSEFKDLSEGTRAYGYDRFGDFRIASTVLDGNGTFKVNLPLARLVDDPDSRIKFSSGGLAEMHVVVRHRKGGGQAIGVPPSPPWYRVLWDRIGDLLKTKVMSPLWRLWIQANITLEGIFATLLVLGLGYYITKRIRRRFFKKKRKFRIKNYADFL